MNKRTGIVASRLVTIGLPLTLILALLMVGNVGAGDDAQSPDGGLVQYKFEVQGSQDGNWEIILPSGFEYVGLAAGTGVAEKPEVSRNRTRVVWNGALAEGEVRFWIAPLGAAVAPDSLAIAGKEAAAIRTEPLAAQVTEPVPGTISPAQVDAVSLTKEVAPTLLEPGDSRWVTYEVMLTNSGTQDVLLDQVVDTLPQDFEFGGMETGAPPAVAGSVLTWANVSVAASQSVELAYYVRAVDTEGDYTNTVVGRSGGANVASDSATLTVESGRIFLPIMCLGCKGPEPETTLPFTEDFSHRSMTGWETFLNWPELSADRWYWGGDDGVWGIYSYEYNLIEPTYEGYALEIYNGPGAQEWTDYRIEASINDVKEENQLKGLTGIWFRGTYQNSGAMDGKVVGGYYLYMKPGDDTLYLMRTPANNPSFSAQRSMRSFLYGPRIGHKHWYKVIIEVRGFNIKVWFGDDGNGIIQVFDWTDVDQTWAKGTVGLAVYNTSSRFDYIHVTPLAPIN